MGTITAVHGEFDTLSKSFPVTLCDNRKDEPDYQLTEIVYYSGKIKKRFQFLITLCGEYLEYILEIFFEDNIVTRV